MTGIFCHFRVDRIRFMFILSILVRLSENPDVLQGCMLGLSQMSYVMLILTKGLPQNMPYVNVIHFSVLKCVM